ncbi:TerD family protein, partial [Rhodococcus sp. IEGM 1354]|uniref:TerD family protein n=1 Tax=Rhodococcus sp. IEGM 1354 TaxID=3047088 RepID=UPI0024B74319
MNTGRKVRNDYDFVFFNQPSSPEGAVRLTSTRSLRIDLRLVPTAVDAIVVAVAADSALSTRAGLPGRS